jgi:hypothetical protein
MFRMLFDDPEEPPVMLPSDLAISIGRGASCDVVINDSAACLVHCRVIARNDRVTLYDAGSREGTFVNDQRITESDLVPGDRIRAGNTLLRLDRMTSEGHTAFPRPPLDLHDSMRGETGDRQLQPQSKGSSHGDATSSHRQSRVRRTGDETSRAETSPRQLRNDTSNEGRCEPPPLPSSGIHRDATFTDAASVPMPLGAASRDAKSGMWYVSRNGKSHGPFTSDELRRKSVSGELVPTDLIRKENGKKWQIAGRTRGLFSPETVKQTPPPLPSEVQVVQPGMLLYLLSHWRETRGNKWAPILLGVLPACVLSFFKPLLTWQNQALIAVLIFTCSVCLLSIYLLIQCYKYTRGQRSVTSESYSRLSCWSHHLMSFVVLLLLPLLFVEYFINNRGLVATAIPVLQGLQDDVFGDTKLPSLIAPLLEWQRELPSVNAPAIVDRVDMDNAQQMVVADRPATEIHPRVPEVNGVQAVDIFKEIAKQLENIGNARETGNAFLLEDVMKNAKNHLQRYEGQLIFFQSLVLVIDKKVVKLRHGYVGDLRCQISGGRYVRSELEALKQFDLHFGAEIPLEVARVLKSGEMVTLTGTLRSIMQEYTSESPRPLLKISDIKYFAVSNRDEGMGDRSDGLEGNDIESLLRRQLGSTFAADEEFEIAASHIGERERVVAGQLIKFRNRDKWSWDRLNNEVEFQFHSIRQPFMQWREDRISAGDRFN